MRNNNDYQHLPPSLTDGREEHFTTLEALTPSPAHYRDSHFEDDQLFKQDNSRYENDRYLDTHVGHEIGHERFVDYIETVETRPADLKYISHENIVPGHDRLDISSHYVHHDFEPREVSSGKSARSEGKEDPGYGEVMYQTMPVEDGGEAFTVSYNVYNTNVNGGTTQPSDILRQAFADLDM